MGVQFFRFRQFSVAQDRCAMKVSTDSVLLGAWADFQGASRILDLGTGTGLLVLMAAQRNDSAQIEGVEIVEAAAGQARENAQASPWKGRITIIHSAIQAYFPLHLYDHIVCNPPYFQSGLQPRDPYRRQARHALTLSAGILLAEARRLLEGKGRLSLILPVEVGKTFLPLAKDLGWQVGRLTEVQTRPSKPVSRLLIELSMSPVKAERNALMIHTDESQAYSQAYLDLTREFYL